MSNTTKKKTAQGVRYTDAQKKEVVDFALSYNAANGRGGQSKAASKFKISQITVASWLKAAGSTTAPAAAVAEKEAKAVKAPKSAKAPKAAKAVKTVKLETAPAAPKAAAAAPKAAAKGKVGTRYTPDQKKEVVDFVASYNAANGRGGQSTAAAKFNVSPLTVMAWLKANGGAAAVKAPARVKYVAPGKAAKAAKAAVAASAAKAAKVAASVKPSAPAAASNGKSNSLVALSNQIAKSEAELAQLKGKFYAALAER
jgi:hypothetical protein